MGHVSARRPNGKPQPSRGQGGLQPQLRAKGAKDPGEVIPLLKGKPIRRLHDSRKGKAGGRGRSSSKTGTGVRTARKERTKKN